MVREPPAPPGDLEPGRVTADWKHRTRVCRLGGRDRSVPCVIVLLKDYLVLVFVCHRGNCVGAGMGVGWQRAQFGIKGATSL